MSQPLYSRLDIVALNDQYGKCLYVIDDINTTRRTNIYDVISLDNKRQKVQIGPQHIAYVVGKADEDSPFFQDEDDAFLVSDEALQNGRMYALRQALASPRLSDRPKWKYLANRNPGDIISVNVTSEGTQDCTFIRCMSGRGNSRFAFVAQTPSGKRYRFLLGSLNLPAE